MVVDAAGRLRTKIGQLVEHGTRLETDETAAIAGGLVSPSNPENDWVGKLRDYPIMGIPLYLVVDARLKTVTLFSRPDGGKYHRREDADFGESLTIPQPFGFDLDTATLLPYA